MPLTAGMQLLLTSLIGAFCFGEWPYAWQMGLGFAGIAFIIAGTVLTTHTEAGQQSTSASDIRHHHGHLLCPVCGLCDSGTVLQRGQLPDPASAGTVHAFALLVISAIVSRRESSDGIFGRSGASSASSPGRTCSPASCGRSRTSLALLQPGQRRRRRLDARRHEPDHRDARRPVHPP